jgi:hypothetical protein
MCSTCSGNYSGDYDESSEYMANKELGALPRGESASLLGAGSGADLSSPQRRVTDRQSKAADPGRWPARASDDWEVLVTAEQIIEIRFLRGDTCFACAPNSDLGPGFVGSGIYCSVVADATGAGRGVSDEENASGVKHSGLWSAKNYGTQSGAPFSGIESSSIRLSYWGLVVFAAACFAVWLLLI